MIKLNLLPTSKKEELKFQFIRAKLLSLFLIVFLGILTLIFFLIGAEVFLSYHLSDIKEQIKNREAAADTSPLQEIKEGVNNLNKKIVALDKIQKEQVRWSEVLVSLSREIPLDLRLKELALKRESKSVFIKGEARSRDAVLTLENNLKQSEIFGQVESPLSNIITKENVIFEFTFYLKESDEGNQ